MREIILILGLVFCTLLQAKDTQLLEEECTKGNTDKCLELGKTYIPEYEEGVTPDFTKSMSFFEKACKGGGYDGCSLLGAIHIRQGAVTKGKKLLVDACDKGYDEACFEVSLFYFDGKYAEKNNKKSLLYAKKACALGHQKGCGAVELDRIENQTELSKNNIKVIEAALLRNKSLLPKLPFSNLVTILSNDKFFIEEGNFYKAKTDFKIFGYKVLYLGLRGMDMMVGVNGVLVGTPEKIVKTLQNKYHMNFTKRNDTTYAKKVEKHYVIIIERHPRIPNASIIIAGYIGP